MTGLCLDFTKTNQAELIQTAIQNSGLTWTRFANAVGMNRSSIPVYLHQKTRISKSMLEKIIKQGFLPASTLSTSQFIAVKHTGLRQDFHNPPLSEALSYFLGVEFGDGSISRNNAVVITSNYQLEENFSKNVIEPLFKNLFGLTPWKNVTPRNAVHRGVYSKQLVKFLVSEFNLTIGKKKNKMHIPIQIKENPEYARAFIRGLFDTDGGLFRHHQTLAQLQLCSLSPGFLQEVSELLTSLGFKNYISGKNLYLCHSKMIDKFFTEIKPANDRLTKKYEIYKQTGTVPLQRELNASASKGF